MNLLKENITMNKQDKLDLEDRIENEGFEYAFIYYSDFKEIKDDRFHELRKAYVKAHNDLEEYIQ